MLSRADLQGGEDAGEFRFDVDHSVGELGAGLVECASELAIANAIAPGSRSADSQRRSQADSVCSSPVIACRIWSWSMPSA